MLSFTGGRTMHVAQSGIFALGTGSHSYLEFDLHERSGQFTLVQLIASVEEPRMTTGGVNLVVGFRPSLWAHVAPEVALIPDGSPGAGGSVVLVQKWMHDAAAFDALPVEEQEKVIGRTKDTSTELDEEVRGTQSHVSRTVIEENGVEQHIFRRNTPFGTATEYGTMFIGFSCDQQRLARMLGRMAG